MVTDPWTSGDFLEAILGPYVDLLGEPLVGSILAVSVFLGFYIYTGSLGMPVVLLLIFGGMLFVFLPGQLAQIGETIIIVALAVAITAIALRYVDTQR